MKTEIILTALDNAFQAEIASLFKILVSGVVTANGDQKAKEDAIARFTTGLSRAVEVLQEAEKAIPTISNLN